MLQRISPSVAFLLSLFLHAAIFASGLWGSRPLQTTPPLTVELPPLAIPETIVETAAENITTAPEPTRAPTPPPPPAPSQSKPSMAHGRSLQQAQAALARHLLYPPEAIAQGLEGEVILLLVLDANSRIISAEIARSSGHAILDNAALAASRQIGALPGNPRQTLLPVRFRLD